MQPSRLTTRGVNTLRNQLIVSQKNKCVLCGCDLASRGGAVLDHDHTTGGIRAVLCKVCNTGEGKLRSVVTRYGGGRSNAKAWLKKLLAYYEKYETESIMYYHPTHLTTEEKRLRRNKRACLTRAKNKRLAQEKLN